MVLEPREGSAHPSDRSARVGVSRLSCATNDCGVNYGSTYLVTAISLPSRALDANYRGWGYIRVALMPKAPKRRSRQNFASIISSQGGVATGWFSELVM